MFGGVRAPTTLGTFLRAFTFGHVRQLDAVAARLLVGLTGRSPLLGGGSPVAFVDVDDTVKQTYGYAKQGARGSAGQCSCPHPSPKIPPAQATHKTS